MCLLSVALLVSTSQIHHDVMHSDRMHSVVISCCCRRKDVLKLTLRHVCPSLNSSRPYAGNVASQLSQRTRELHCMHGNRECTTSKPTKSTLQELESDRPVRLKGLLSSRISGGSGRMWCIRGLFARMWPQSVVHCRTVMMIVALFIPVLGAGTAGQAMSTGAGITAGISTTPRTSSTTETTTTTPDLGCGGVVRCLTDDQCHNCLISINSSSGCPHSTMQSNNLGAALQAQQLAFFTTLSTTLSCYPDATQPAILHPALQELAYLSVCNVPYSMNVGECALAEYACFVDVTCRQCLATLTTKNGTDAEILRTPACMATNPALLEWINVYCDFFPECTYMKQKCDDFAECASCLGMLVTGDGAGAALQCGAKTQPAAAVVLDYVVDACTLQSASGCSYWLARCNENAVCGRCLASMGNDNDIFNVVADYLAPTCQLAIQDPTASTYLTAVATGCPGVSDCRRTVGNCVNFYSETCVSCLNGSAPPSDEFICSDLLVWYNFEDVCQSCADSVYTNNMIVLVTAVIGGASAVVCIAVMMTIVAHDRDRASMRDRIVIGLMMANALYSTANTIPLNMLHTGVTSCGRLFMSFDAIRFGRAWWFCGKYALVSFELLIVGASIRALLRGLSAVSPRVEAILHTASCTVGVLAFAVFYAMCDEINAAGYNAATETQAFTNAYNHVSVTDDHNDDSPATVASERFQAGREAYDNLVRDMLIVWDVFAGVAILLWIALRLMYRQILLTLSTEMTETLQAEAGDEWGETRRSSWVARRQLLKESAFAEVAKPLEPYIVVFMLFAVPAVVMSTTYCQTNSGATTALRMAVGGGGVPGFGAASFTYGTCYVWCEFALAFRSLGTVIVYLTPRERRVELVAMLTSFRKLRARLMGCFYQGQKHYDVLDNHAGGIEMNELVQESNHTNNGSVDVNADSMAWLIQECDITMVRRLGKGAYGDVWEGQLHPENIRVAVKILHMGAVDADGDVIDPRADHDFRKECAALQCIDSPHLIKFFGYGTSKSGAGFIVTELMPGGSLEEVLHDKTRELYWPTRMSVGLQVALGMAHLHHRRILHRDLKSANVLLNEQLAKAKVCDFGLARRMTRPSLQHIVYSPFTGAIQRISLPNDAVATTLASASTPPLLSRDVAVSVLDARGTMTRAAGTLLWMAPEVFRGDVSYSTAVDVYSFGIVLWELATRKLPWFELPSSETAFFVELNRALQTGRRPVVSSEISTTYPRFVDVMQQCWSGDPADRPSFTVVANALALCLRSCTEESVELEL